MKSFGRTVSQCVLFAVILVNSTQFSFGQGTAFTYQGRLDNNSAPANGNYDITFKLFNAASGPSQIGNTLTNSVAVSNGLFTVTLDFNAGAFDGSARWLEIAVRTNGDTFFFLLNPRQAITATPYALVAGTVTGVIPNAGLSGNYGSAVTLNNVANQFTGSFTGNGSGLSNLNATTLAGLTASAFWKTTGNNGTSPTNGNFLGTTDNQALELRVNGARALRLQPTTNTANIIGGWVSNAVNIDTLGLGTVKPTVVGAVIGGGGALTEILNGPFGIVTYTNLPNSVNADYGTIGGGLGNQIGYGQGPLESRGATIGGGVGNQISSIAMTGDGATGSTIGGGMWNKIYSADIEGFCNTVSGGQGNQIGKNATFSFIGGGRSNAIVIGSVATTIAGGSGNLVNQCTEATIGGGADNEIYPHSDGAVIAGGRGNELGTYDFGPAIDCVISGGSGNIINYGFSYSIIGGGKGNQIVAIGAPPLSTGCVIAGGTSNTLQFSSSGSFVGAGMFNLVRTQSVNSVIAGGYSNTIAGAFAMIPGGLNNFATSNAFAAGSFALATNQGAFVWADYNSSNFAFSSINTNEFAARTTGGVRFVTAIDGSGNATAGVKLDPGSTSWATISDRNAKKDFAPVNTEALLDKLARVPVEQWHYNWESAGSTPHIGPMAQDFKSAFYPGRDDKSITTLEFDGVELAAIQGLNQKLAEKDARITELEQRLARLEKLVSESIQKR